MAVGFIHKDEAVAGARNMAGEVGKCSYLWMEERRHMQHWKFVSISAVKQKMKEAGMEGSFDELLIQYQAGDKRQEKYLTQC